MAAVALSKASEGQKMDLKEQAKAHIKVYVK